jgi:hypothetical protein
MFDEGEPTEVEPNQAAIVFGPDGISMLLPPSVTGDSKEDVPAYVLAAAELLFRDQEEGVDPSGGLSSAHQILNARPPMPAIRSMLLWKGSRLRPRLRRIPAQPFQTAADARIPADGLHLIRPRCPCDRRRLHVCGSRTFGGGMG